MKKIIAIIIAVVAIGGLASIWYFNQPEDTPASTATTQSTQDNKANTGTSDQPQTEQSFTAAQVAAHDSSDDCWTIINGSVYDITSYVPRHPGGEEILRACGVNGTSLFESRTTPDGESVGSGTQHSSSAQSQLESLKIGTLE